MKLPNYAPVRSDRTSTREELFEVLEMLGGFEEPKDMELASTCDLFTSFGADPTISAAQILDGATSNEERLLMEMEPFITALRSTGAETIN